MYRYKLLSILLTYLVVPSCKEPVTKRFSEPLISNTGSIIPANKDSYTPDAEWKRYWYAGKAEITSYTLKQSRYGEIHEGNIVNIFVTEDFSTSKQVKPDDANSSADGTVGILKLNQAVKFVTGIYPYSLMLSVFSPVDINRYQAIKVVASAQEWCGTSFFQLNNRNNKFFLEQRSYFEQEGDQDLAINQVLLEDELWNLIRIDPLKLPKGSHLILPGALYLRLSHKQLKPQPAILELVTGDSTSEYKASFTTLNRTLVITFENKFPYSIVEWKDSFPGLDGQVLTTTAVRNKTMLTDYWKAHTNKDRKLRADLGLPVDTQ